MSKVGRVKIMMIMTRKPTETVSDVGRPFIYLLLSLVN